MVGQSVEVCHCVSKFYEMPAQCFGVSPKQLLRGQSQITDIG